jgi:3',5'-cyclic AMP phosphodiesterase CpdA
MTDETRPDQDADGIDRRGFLKCMAWAGTGVLWTLTSGVLSSRTFAQAAADERAVAQGSLHFAQISDSHIGFNKPANPDVAATLQVAIDRINALPIAPSFLIHTGDITQLAQADQFDTSEQLLKSAKADRVFYVPGEHDVAGDDGKLYRQRYGKDARGAGWYSFDQQGVHFIGLVNVIDLKTGGLGNLGQEQLAWLEKDLKGKRSSTPIVVFAHIPLWMVYPDWGWGTADGEQALSSLKRFGSVTVLNGHIHQTMQKVEGNITFHTATSTAFPQPAPGKAAGPGPMKVPADKLREVLGITTVNYVKGNHSLAIVDSSLA